MYRTLRAFSTTAARLNSAAAAPAPKRKVGAFRGGLLGFLLGSSITGYGAYYYLFDEYRSTNTAMLSDVMQLQDSIRNLETHVADLEHKLNAK